VSIFGTGGPSVPRSPKIWSPATAVINAGNFGSFTVKATGSPTPEFSYTGTRPTGVTFVDNHDGTATLSGTPAAGTEGDYTLNITASNGVQPNGTQALTLSIATAPAITSLNAHTCTMGSPCTFTVTATGGSATIIPSLSAVGALPAGMTFADNEDGTGTLAGTPEASGIYLITFTASDGAPPDAVASSNNLTVNFSVSFLPAFSGSKNIYLYVHDVTSGLNSGWTTLGTWNLASTAPTAVSITPNAGSASSQVFQAVYSDPAGAAKITGAYLMINNMVSWTGACGTRYDQATNRLFIINDVGNGWIGPITPGAVATLQNSKCTLDGATSSVVASGNNLTVNFSVSFLPAFAGNKNMYMYAHDATNGLNSGWKLVGTWSPAAPKPVAVSVTPTRAAQAVRCSRPSIPMQPGQPGSPAHI
jgi:hypothetical protein